MNKFRIFSLGINVLFFLLACFVCSIFLYDAILINNFVSEEDRLITLSILLSPLTAIPFLMFNFIGFKKEKEDHFDLIDEKEVGTKSSVFWAEDNSKKRNRIIKASLICVLIQAMLTIWLSVLTYKFIEISPGDLRYLRAYGMLFFLYLVWISALIVLLFYQFKQNK